MPIRRLEKTYTGTTSTIGGDEIAASTIPVKPHIQPGVLQPAVAGKLLDGTTNHSGAYGTAQSDGKSYYYTDIKGSGPIKDPRIGAHFGSQRHKTRSTQLLEQETAIHGSDVLSIDGREWMRWVKATGSEEKYDSTGHTIKISNGDVEGYVEFVGYFSDANISIRTETSQDEFSVKVDGGSPVNANLSVSASSPLTGRYVDSGSVINLGGAVSNLPVTLGIHTVRIVPEGGGSNNIHIYSIELIAQDTSSTANRSKIQIPSQNVVSYGKKFSVSGTPHYNPFAFKTDGTTAWASGAHNGTSWPVGTGSSANIDTATSLGLANWLHSSNYYKPYNGGRVVIWVASDGTIKTSVNVMPPNARSIANSASLTNATAKANASIANNTAFPTMEAGTIDHSLAEVAKTFHWREFGNGAGNGGANAAGSNNQAPIADMSMIMTTRDDIAYVMDDGLTGLTGIDVKLNTGWSKGGEALPNDDSGDGFYFTFIGTGMTLKNVTESPGTDNLVQNLPYGTHVVSYFRGNLTATPILKVDGITVTCNTATYGKWYEVTYHQPKKPPIPEDAVVLADYMLMADHVIQGDAEDTQISKGVRYVNGSRDHFCNVSGGSFQQNSALSAYLGNFGGLRGFDSPSGNTATAKLPFFGTNAQAHIQGQHTAGWALVLGGMGLNEVLLDSGAGSFGDIVATNSGDARPLGLIDLTTTVPAGGNGFHGTAVATPTHTSHHYQSFETPFLKELVGGDRNMEQTNLVVTADGKTWDEVTRDTSYIGNLQLRASHNNHYTSESSVNTFDEWRGYSDGVYGLMNKDFAIGYYGMVCLVDGEYTINSHNNYNENGQRASQIKVNGALTLECHQGITGGGAMQNNPAHTSITLVLKRGDFVQIYGCSGNYNEWTSFEIIRN